jgi:DNA-directed RNA polymerase alpha subunit
MEHDEILKHRLADVRWPTVRIRNALVNEWPEGTLGDLILATRAEMLRVPNFGRGSFEQTVETLANLGLRSQTARSLRKSRCAQTAAAR